MTRLIALVSITFAVILPDFCLCNDAELLISSEQGKLSGKYMKTRNNREFRAFMSIPYAKPPVGDLRFMPPVPFGKWTGTLDATAIHGVCPQRNIYTRDYAIFGTEDCLYLNVYAPKTKEISEALPVMVFFHGGGYLACGGNVQWYGPDILLDRDVILVVPNYRLGALGFLSTGDEIFPGNNGMKDQALSIKWVKDNIQKFGGDPNRITVFGESAGGSAAHLHMMSPLSKNLISTAISQSGTALAPWTIMPRDRARANAHKLATLLRCPIECSEGMRDCLRKLKAYRFVELDTHFMEWDTEPMIPFPPVVEPEHEGAYLSEHPQDIIKTGKIASIPWMVGVTSSDGALRAPSILKEPHLREQINEDFERVAPILNLYEHYLPNVDEVTQKIRKFYFSDKEINEDTKQDLVNMITDSWFLNATDFAVRLHQKYTKDDVFVYEFAHRGVASFTEVFGDKDNDYGVCHADDLQYLFPVGDMLFPDKRPSQDDKDVAELITTLWVNFAKYGTPTLETDSLPKWLPAKTSNIEYYRISVPALSQMKDEYFPKRLQFWRQISQNKNSIRDEL